MASLGSIMAIIAKFTFWNANQGLLQSLKQDATELEQQRNAFASISKGMPLVCIFEEFEKDGVLVSTFDSVTAQEPTLYVLADDPRDTCLVSGCIFLASNSLFRSCISFAFALIPLSSRILGKLLMKIGCAGKLCYH